MVYGRWFVNAFEAAIVVALVQLGATLPSLDETWVLVVVAVAAFVMTYWAVQEEDRHKRV
jgi:hypothetical protein